MSEQKVMMIPLRKITYRMTENRQAIWPYREIDKSHVDNLVSLNEPHNWNNIQVVPKDFIFNPEGEYWLLDGMHRVQAAGQLNLALNKNRNGYKPITELSAFVRLDIKNDIQAASEMFRANLRHGKPPTKEEKKNHLRWIRGQFPDLWEGRQENLAKIIGASQQTISRLMTEIENEEDEQITRENRDFNKQSRALMRQLIKVHQSEGSFFTGNKMSGQFKKFILEEMLNDRDANKAIKVLARSLSDVVETYESTNKER